MSVLSLERPGRREALVVAALIVAAVFAIYAPVRHHEFVNLDDVDGILENPLFLEGFTPATLARHFTEPYQHNWVPLNWLSLHLNHLVSGRDPTGYLLTNVALHALGSLLLFGVLLRMTGAFYCSAFTALFFAVHPLHVESVAWASERKDVLSGVFFMLTLWAYVRHVERGGGLAGMLGVTALLLLGLLSKPMLVTTPFVLLLLDLWPLQRLRAEGDARWIDGRLLWARSVEKWPLFAAVLAVSVITWAVQAGSGAMSDLERIPLGSRIANAANALLAYLSQTVLPQGMAALYPYPGEPDWAGAGGAALLVGGVSVVALATRRERPYLLVGWLWFLGMLTPVIGLVQVGIQAHADRYMYLPQIGLGLALAWSAAEVVRQTPAARAAFAVGGTLVLGWFGGVAWQQVQVWQDSLTLYSHALSVTSGNYLAHKALGDALLAEGRSGEALRHYAHADSLHPHWMDAELGIADVYAVQNQLPEAEAIYRKWMERDPDGARPVGSLGLVLLRAGRFAEAIPALEKALRIDPGAAELLAGLAAALDATGRRREARDAYREALRRNPDLTAAANNLAWVLAVSSDPEIRDPAEAIRLARQALARTPGGPMELDTLAAAYAAAGRFPEAVAAADEAIEKIRALGAGDLAADMERRRALYLEGRPYVEDAGPPGAEGPAPAPATGAP